MTQSTTTLQPHDRKRITFAVIGALLGVGSIAAILSMMLFVGYTPPPPTPGLKTPQQRLDILNKSRAEDQKALTSYTWVDRPNGIVRIPIDAAMTKIIDAANTGKPLLNLPATQPATTQTITNQATTTQKTK